MIVVYQQDRRFEGGAELNVARVTKDGGKTWRRLAASRVSHCVGGSSAYQSDPWLTFDRSGVAHLYPGRGPPETGQASALLV